MFRLVHVSDPHLGPLPRVRITEMAGKRALGLANWWRGRRHFHKGAVLAALIDDIANAKPDHIAVTGDLVNVGLAGEYAAAAQWLAALGAPEAVSLVPGNHDAYVRRTAPLALASWGPFMAGDGVAPGFPYVRRRGPLALIGLSSAVPTGPFMATGRLGAVQLEGFAALLRQAREAGLCRVVLLHHPPVGRPGDRMKRLLDRAAFQRIIAQEGAELVLHGHDHRHRVAFLPGPLGQVPVVGVASASADPAIAHRPAAFHLFDIAGGPGAWRTRLTVRGFAPGGGPVTTLDEVDIAAAIAG